MYRYALLFIISLVLIINCETPPVEIREVKYYKITNYIEQFKDFKNFMVISGKSFSLTIEDNIITLPNTMTLSANNVDLNGSLIAAVISDDIVVDGTITVSVDNSSDSSDIIEFSAIESTVDNQVPIILLNYVTTGTSYGSYDINFTIMDDTAVVAISTNSGSLFETTTNNIWPSGTYNLRNIPITSQTVMKLTVMDIAGHTADSDEAAIP